MPFSITDVVTEATADEWTDKLLAAASALGLKTTAWQPGGITRTIIKLVAQVLYGADKTVSIVAAGGFLKLAAAVTPDPSAKGADGTYPTGPGWLDICADSGFDVQRIGATYASGPMVLTNASGSSYGPFAAGTYHIQNPTTKKTYKNVAPLTIAAGPAVDTTATFEADEAGADSTSSASAITQPVTSLVGVSIDTLKQSGTLTGTNAESNSALVVRCTDKLSALAPKLGGDSAYAYFAKIATEPPSRGGGGIVLAGGKITRVLVESDLLTGVTTVTLANAGGAPSGGDVTAVNTYLQGVCVPDAVTTRCQAASVGMITPIVDVWVPAAYAAEVVQKVKDAITAYIDTLPIGGIPATPGGMKGVPFGGSTIAIGKAASYIADVDLQLNGSPNDVALGVHEVAKTVASGSITVNVHTT